MNIERVQSYFSEWNGLRSDTAHHLEFDDRGACGHFDALRLYSAFQPLVETASGCTVAHEALLRPRNAEGQSINPADAFAALETAQEIVYFDRLCRMVHTVNFVHLGDRRGDLFLNVDFRHLLSVRSGDHGQAFEILLDHCGVKPEQIVLEVIESRIEDLQLLDEAVNAYRQRGFRIAIDDFGAQHSNFDRLWRLTPDIVKLDRSLVVEASTNPRARRILPKIVDLIHDLGARVVCEGIETGEQHALAADAGADLLQGFLYGKPSVALFDRNTGNLYAPSGTPVEQHNTFLQVA